MFINEWSEKKLIDTRVSISRQGSIKCCLNVKKNMYEK